MFWFLGNIWAQGIELGIFPVRSVEVSDQERLLIDQEVLDAVSREYAGQFDIVLPDRIQAGLKDIEIPKMCTQGRCALALAKSLGLERLVDVTVHRDREKKYLRVTLYDVEKAVIIRSRSSLVPKGESWTGIIPSLVREEKQGKPAQSGIGEEVSSVIEVQERNITAVLVPEGTYSLRDEDKQPVGSFLMMKSEVTQAMYQELIKKKPSHFTGCEDCPVERVSWYDAVQFANSLSRQHKHTACYEISSRGVSWDKSCDGWRLPTELEWYYAAAGAKESPMAFGGSEVVDENAWYRGNAGGRVHRVCQKRENPVGLCDMTGNVWEWVWNNERTEEGIDASLRILRGGSWGNRAEKNRISVRLAYKPVVRNYAIGFRLVRSR